MNVATTQLTTRLRTWALVTGLTALTIAIGAMLGGTFLWLFVAFAVAFNVVGYFFSDRIALRVAHARPIRFAEAPELYAIVEPLAERADIPMPRLYVMPGEQPNAFATGRNAQHAAVALTEGLLTTMEPEHVRGVVAHELAHIRNHDILVSSILAPIAAALLQLGVSRQREYLADATAARLLGSGAPLADALAEIERTHAPALQIEPATAPGYIANPLGGGTVATLFSTHPPVRERIRRLRAYGQRARTERTASTARLSGA